MMRQSILISFLLFSSFLFAQTNKVVVKGNVTDISRNPIPYATIQNTATEEGTNSDLKGRYIFKTTLPATLKVSLIGYETQLEKISPEAGKDTIQINFVLKVDSSELQQVEVSATHEPELLKESASLVDFDLSKSHLFLLNELRQGDRVVIYDSNAHTIGFSPVKFHVDSLKRNERNDIYYTHDDSLYILYYNRDSNLFETFSLSLDVFTSLEPVKAYNPPYYYYEHPLDLHAGVTYTAYDSKTKQQKILYTYFDNTILDENIDTYETLEEIESRVHVLLAGMGSSAAPQVRKLQAHERNYISMKVCVYSQICVVNNKVCIFNFDNDTLTVYDSNNVFKQELPMLFDRKKYAISKKEILTDDDKSDCYFKFEKNGITYIQRIDLTTGQPLGIQSIKFPFIEKLRISKGYAYYTYSNTGDNQMFIRHLYRQKIN